MKRVFLSMLFCAAAASPGAADDGYPTAVRVEYVRDCMIANGETFESLHDCSCSIDYLATKLTLQEYEQVETIVNMIKVPGERTGMFRDVPWMGEVVGKFEQAQGEALSRCFGS